MEEIELLCNTAATQHESVPLINVATTNAKGAQHEEVVEENRDKRSSSSASSSSVDEVEPEVVEESKGRKRPSPAGTKRPSKLARMAAAEEAKQQQEREATLIANQHEIDLARAKKADNEININCNINMFTKNADLENDSHLQYIISQVISKMKNKNPE